MIELFEQDIKIQNRQSSKGNQLKWIKHKDWYKADYLGYEGLAEYIVSYLLKSSSLSESEYVIYHTEQIKYKFQTYLGCQSRNFLPEGWEMVTLERLFQNLYKRSLSKVLYEIKDYENRIRFLVNQTIVMTGLEDFGVYMSKMLTIDSLFLNEDRHMHNIAVLLDEKGKVHYCPYFDHGASLLSDTMMDYPIGVDVHELMKTVSAKTFCSDFDDQLDIVENLYGQHLRFHFTENDIVNLLENEQYYGVEMKKRIYEILMAQKRKYNYLFQ